MDLNAFLTPVGFSSLLGQLVSAENEQRKQAEAVFEQVKQQQPEACAGNLLAALRSAPEVEHRSFAAIMLRKVNAMMMGRGAKVPRLGTRALFWQMVDSEFACVMMAMLWDRGSSYKSPGNSQKSTPPISALWTPVLATCSDVQVLVTDHQNIWGSISPSMQVSHEDINSRDPSV